MDRLETHMHETTSELDARLRGLARSLAKCASESLDDRLPAKLEALCGGLPLGGKRGSQAPGPDTEALQDAVQ